MAKLTRVTQIIFGQNGDPAHFGQFGSKAVGAPVLTLDPASIQSLSAFQQNGWLDAVVNANKQPFLEDMNGLFRVAFYQLGNIFQDGVPAWNAGTAYYIGSIVKKDGTTELYGSLTDNNMGNALPVQTDNANWHYLNPLVEAAGIVKDFAGATTPFGYLDCDGTAYTQAAWPALFTAIGTGWNTYRGAADPGAGNFRVPDLRSQSTIGAGQAPGLTNRVLATFTGEETVTLTIAQMPVHDHPITDPGHFHREQVYQSPGGSDSSVANTASVPGGTTIIAPHPAGTTKDPTNIVIENRGGGGAHDNMQPSAVVKKIIKT